MEEEDHMRLFARFKTEGQHRPLNCHRSEHEEVIAGEPGAPGIGKVGCNQEAEQEGPEEARPGLLDAEADEFVERLRGAVLLGPIANQRLLLDKARQRRPNAGGTWRSWL